MAPIQDTCPRRGGFTLAELLLSVSIVAALAMLVIPVIHQMKSDGEAQICRSHLNQIGKAFLIYMDDNKDRMPDADGDEFISRLYSTGVLEDPNVYLCPASGEVSTTDNVLTGGEDLSYAGRQHASSPIHRAT